MITRADTDAERTPRAGARALRDWLARLADWAEAGCCDEPISRDDARAILAGDTPLLPTLHAAGLVRRRFWGTRVQAHILNNVQNGACPEDCGYCGQSKDSRAPIQPYKLKSREEIIAEAAHAKANGAFRYCMVLSGRGPSDADIEHMAGCIREIKARFGLQTCLSSGLLDEAKARRLKDAGLDRLNHNLNTSRAWYPRICTTHTYDDRVNTLRAAREAGLQLCSGLIVGMGEAHEDVLDAALALRAARVESIPVNFLVPIPGNRVREPVCDGAALAPELCLRALCAVRLLNPSAEVRVAAGRETHLRHMQALALEPASSLFIDGYLLTKGSGALDTLRMIRDAGFEIELPGGAPEALVKALERLEREQAGLGAIGSDVNGFTGVEALREDRVSQRKLAQLRVRSGDQ